MVPHGASGVQCASGWRAHHEFTPPSSLVLPMSRSDHHPCFKPIKRMTSTKFCIKDQVREFGSRMDVSSARKMALQRYWSIIIDNIPTSELEQRCR